MFFNFNLFISLNVLKALFIVEKTIRFSTNLLG